MATTPSDPTYQSSLAAVLNDWALVRLQRGDHEGARPVLKEAVDRQRAAIKLQPRRPLYRQYLSSHLANWADVLAADGKHGDAVAVAREALAIQAALADDFPDVLHYRHARAERASDLGRLLMNDDRDAAAAAFREAIGVLEPLADTFGEVPARPLLLADCEKDLGIVLDAAGRPAEAAGHYRAALKWRPNDAGVLNAYGRHLLQTDQFAAAEPVWRRCLDVRQQRQPDSWMTFDARGMLGMSLFGQDKFAEAEPLLLAGFQGLKEREATLDAGDRIHLLRAIDLLAQLYDSWDRPEKAAEWRKTLAAHQADPKKN